MPTVPAPAAGTEGTARSTPPLKEDNVNCPHIRYAHEDEYGNRVEVTGEPGAGFPFLSVTQTSCQEPETVTVDVPQDEDGLAMVMAVLSALQLDDAYQVTSVEGGDPEGMLAIARERFAESDRAEKARMAQIREEVRRARLGV